MATFHIRRELSARELLPAVEFGLGVGTVAAYLVQLMLRKERVPPRPADQPAGG